MESGAHAIVTGGYVTALLVDLDPEAAQLLRDALLEEDADGLCIEQATHLADALARLSAGDIDVVLVAPNHGVDALARIRAVAADALILPLSGGAPGTAAADRAARLEARRSDVGWVRDALRYVTCRRMADEALFEEKERVRVTLSSIGDAVLVTDLRGRVSYLNPVAEGMTGWTCAAAVGRPLAEVFDIIDGVSRTNAADPAQRAIREDQTVGLEANCVLRRPDGTESGIEDSAAPVHDRHGRVAGAVIVFRDISQSRAVTQEMAYLARHDSLTHLANRSLLNERLGQAMKLAHRHEKKVALLFVDLDEFKKINDTLGHATGDQVLKRVAHRLIDCVRATDTVCRQGGDEFLILLSEIDQRDDAVRIAAKVRAAFEEPLRIGERRLRVSMSIGIGLYPDDGETVDALMEQADNAMYRAKTQGRVADAVRGD